MVYMNINAFTAVSKFWNHNVVKVPLQYNYLVEQLKEGEWN